MKYYEIPSAAPRASPAPDDPDDPDDRFHQTRGGSLSSMKGSRQCQGQNISLNEMITVNSWDNQGIIMG